MGSVENLAEVLRRQAASNPAGPALLCGDEEITYGDIDRRSSQVANALLERGVQPQDRLAFLGRNGPEFFEFLFGAAKLNAVPVAVSWRLAPAEIGYILADSRAKVLVVEEEFTAVVEAAAADLDRDLAILVIGGHERWSSYGAAVDGQPETDPAVNIRPGDTAVQMYTSGTTGHPKGVMLSNRGLGIFLTNLVGLLDLRPDSVSAIVLPLFHIGGSAWALLGLTAGCRSVLLRDADPAMVVEAVVRHRVDTLMLVPALLQFMMAMPGSDAADLSSVKTFVYGGSPITEPVLRQAIARLGCDFVQLYGLTEASGAICSLAPADHDVNRPERLRSCGRPFPWVEVRVVDPDTRHEARPGEIGELWTRSEQNMLGYWQQPEATAAAFTDDGWLRTGDLGYRDRDGYLFLHDRMHDMIVTGGENVYPLEVEHVLMAHPGVADVAVIGVPDDRWGETVKAVVVAGPEGVDAAGLIGFARERLAHFKCPTSVDFADELPRTPAGKVRKRDLREPYWAGRDRRVS